MALSNISSKFSSPLQKASKDLESNFEKLSSGRRINRASDDAAGLAIVAQLESQVHTATQAVRNANDGISLADIAASTLRSVNDINTRMQELATQAANGTLSAEQRKALNSEYQALAEEANRQLESAEFNGSKIFNAAGTVLQVGNTGDPSAQISLPAVDTAALKSGVPNILTADAARQAIDDLSTRISNTSSLIGQIGAARSRVETAASSASSYAVTAEESAGRIRDADIATTVADLTRNKILQQSGVAIQAQANLSSQMVLKLLS